LRAPGQRACGGWRCCAMAGSTCVRTSGTAERAGDDALDGVGGSGWSRRCSSTPWGNRLHAVINGNTLQGSICAC
jgi:hypothetical protein